jgi:hypothetical protein
MNLSHELGTIYAIEFLIRLYLIFLIVIQIFDVMGLKFNSEKPKPKKRKQQPPKMIFKKTNT